MHFLVGDLRLCAAGADSSSRSSILTSILPSGLGEATMVAVCIRSYTTLSAARSTYSVMKLQLMSRAPLSSVQLVGGSAIVASFGPLGLARRFSVLSDQPKGGGRA